ncbi:MAG: aldo/keto reductase [Candidatus Marinimicrobia bacterium]|nr:aldo/keto reductase [Candidatus Neomarinimicrobiota bacterium]
MQYKRFGNTGMQVSRYCLGAMTFPNRLDIDGSRRIVDQALDRGVNFIDTANSYGMSEEVLGKILDGPKRERIYLATKVYRRFCRDGRTGRNSRVNLISSLERSLRLLQTDYVDLYQLHHPDPDTPIEETMATLDLLVRQGKIRYVGVSNHYAWQMAVMIAESKAHHWEPIVSLQANYDILDRQLERETRAFLREFNIALMCYSPLAGGLLTGKYEPGQPPPEGSRAGQSEPLRQMLEDEGVQSVLTRLAALATDRALKMNQLAVLWLLQKPAVTSVILGGHKSEHYNELYDVADSSLDEKAEADIDAMSAQRVYTVYRNQPIAEGFSLAEQW